MLSQHYYNPFLYNQLRTTTRYKMQMARHFSAPYNSARPSTSASHSTATGRVRDSPKSRRYKRIVSADVPPRNKCYSCGQMSGYCSLLLFL